MKMAAISSVGDAAIFYSPVAPAASPLSDRRQAA
jgi:hypothetical protein